MHTRMRRSRSVFLVGPPPFLLCALLNLYQTAGSHWYVRVDLVGDIRSTLEDTVREYLPQGGCVHLCANGMDSPPASPETVLGLLHSYTYHSDYPLGGILPHHPQGTIKQTVFALFASTPLPDIMNLPIPAVLGPLGLCP